MTFFLHIFLTLHLLDRSHPLHIHQFTTWRKIRNARMASFIVLQVLRRSLRCFSLTKPSKKLFLAKKIYFDMFHLCLFTESQLNFSFNFLTRLSEVTRGQYFTVSAISLELHLEIQNCESCFFFRECFHQWRGVGWEHLVGSAKNSQRGLACFLSSVFHRAFSL